MKSVWYQEAIIYSLDVETFMDAKAMVSAILSVSLNA